MMQRMEERRRAEQVGKLRGVQCAAAVLGIGVMMLACVPDVGAVTWFLGIPVALIVIVLSIVSLAKGGFFFGVFGLLGGLIVIPLWCFAAPMAVAKYGSFWERTSAPDASNAAERWAQNSLADPRAEVLGVTPIREFRGDSYSVARVRARNSYGAQITEVVILKLTGGADATAYRLPEFREMISDVKAKLSASDAASLEAEYQAMCRAFGIDVP
jgi:hypothetical protein